MSDHTHTQYVEGCYRCDLGRDEVGSIVTDEMIEKAARESFAAGAENAAREYGLDQPITWEDISDRDHNHWCLCTRAALSAVLPDIIQQAKAEALREAADERARREPTILWLSPYGSPGTS